MLIILRSSQIGGLDHNSDLYLYLWKGAKRLLQKNAQMNPRLNYILSRIDFQYLVPITSFNQEDSRRKKVNQVMSTGLLNRVTML